MKSSDGDAGNKPPSDTTASVDWPSESTRGASSRLQGVTSSSKHQRRRDPEPPGSEHSLTQAHKSVNWPAAGVFVTLTGARRHQDARLQTRHNPTANTRSFQQLCQPRSALGAGLALCQGGHLSPTHGRLCCPGCAETEQGFDVAHDCCDWLCGYRNVASLYLHSAHVTFLIAFALVIGGYTDACLGQIKRLSRVLRVHQVTGSW